jgi:hypothetical protein
VFGGAEGSKGKTQRKIETELLTMKIRGLLTAGVILAALTGFLYWSNHRKPDEKPPVDTPDTPPKVLTLDQTTVNSIELAKKGEDPIRLAKNLSGQWSITSPKQLGADQESISSLLSTLSSLNSDRLVEDKATNLDQYGLAQPSLSVTATPQNGKTVKLMFGDDTPTGNGSYAALSGDPRVFIIAKYNRSTFEKSLNDLRDKRLLVFDSEKLTRVELTAKKQSIEFGRTKDQWQIVKPKPVRADQSAVDDLVRSLHDAKMELSPSFDEKKSSAAFNSASPLASAKITDVSGTQELQLRKSKDDYYAKSSLVSGIYKISSSTASALDKSLDDFRNKKLFEFGYVDPDKIQLHDGAKETLLEHTKGDWWSNGAKMDSESVNSLLSRIRDLPAAKFPDSGFTSALLEISVISNEGKRAEKVLVSKNGDRYIAKREGEPALYELDATAINDLRNAADGLKPAPAPAPAPPPAKK